MLKQLLTALSVLVFGVLCMVTAAPSGSAMKDDIDTVSTEEQLLTNKELMFLLELVAPLKRLSQDADYIQKLVERMAHMNGDHEKVENLVGEIYKRQGQWDMDYGWGGGRFGKRGGGSDGKASSKRYDMYGMSGRFGRDLDHVSAVLKHEN